MFFVRPQNYQLREKGSSHSTPMSLKPFNEEHWPLEAPDSGFHDVPGGPDDVSCVGGPTPGEHGEQRHSGRLVERPVPQVYHQLHVGESHLHKQMYMCDDVCEWKQHVTHYLKETKNNLCPKDNNSPHHSPPYQTEPGEMKDQPVQLSSHHTLRPFYTDERVVCTFVCILPEIIDKLSGLVSVCVFLAQVHAFPMLC